MSYLSRRGLIGWAVIILIAVNVGAIAVFVYQIYFNKETSFERPSHHSQEPDSFLIRELGLDKSQEMQFATLKKVHMDKVHSFVNQIKIEKKLLAESVVAENADTIKLDSIADRIGDLYASIRKANTRHYFDLKKICNPDQQKKLADIFGNVFCCDERKGCRGNGGPNCCSEKPKAGCNEPNNNKY